SPAEITQAVETTIPENRRRLLPLILAHADYLTTTFDMIDEPHRQAGEKLVAWIAARYSPGRPLHITVVCTGNSRRSILGAAMGTTAAAYHGMPELRSHGAGTAPPPFNSRPVAALKAIGVEVESTGRKAPRGETATPNPVYRVRWGRPGASGEPALEAIEF